jgi:hypothetical protein
MADNEIPELVRRLCSVDDDRRPDAFGTLYHDVVNRGRLSSRAAEVVDLVLAQLEPTGRLPYHAWWLLQQIFNGTSYGKTVEIAGTPVDIEDYVRPRIAAALPLIEDALADIELEELLEGLALLLLSLARRSYKVVEMVERELSKTSGERHEALALTLREVRETWDEAQEAAGA